MIRCGSYREQLVISNLIILLAVCKFASTQSPSISSPTAPYGDCRQAASPMRARRNGPIRIGFPICVRSVSWGGVIGGSTS